MTGMTMGEEITAIRERLARIETKIEAIQHKICDKKNGNIVIPVAVVVAIAEVLTIIMNRLF